MIQSNRIKLLSLLLSVCLLTGCAAVPALQPQESGTAQEAPLQPGSGIPGYYGAGQQLTGGTQGLAAELASIELKRRQEEYVFTLQFGGEALPEYTVTLLQDPARVLLTLPKAQAGFAGQHLEQEGQFCGMFYTQQGDALNVYLQFTGNTCFKLAESDQALTLTTRADDFTEGQSYFVRLPYTTEVASQATEHGMTPALCDDLATMTYISAPFATQAEAETLNAELDTNLEGLRLDAMPQISVMSKGENPAYLSFPSRTQLTQMGVLQTAGGALKKAAIFATDARFLCYTPDQKSAIMAKPFSTTDDAGMPVTYEEVWRYAFDGSVREKLFDGEFNTLQKAAVSPDGQYLAIIEQLSGMRMVYVYTFEGSTLDLLSTQGFGEYTADMAWSQNNKLYAMTGDDMMQLLMYDPTLAQSEQSATNGVEEREGSFGNIACTGNYVYFYDDNGDVMRVDTTTGVRELFALADGFRMDPTGTYAALSSYVDQDDGSMIDSLSVLPTAGGVQQSVVMDNSLGAYCFSSDGSQLYFITDNKGDVVYPVTLHAYEPATGTIRTLGNMSNTSMFAGTQPDQLILTSYYEMDSAFFPVTYILTLDLGAQG